MKDKLGTIYAELGWESKRQKGLESSPYMPTPEQIEKKTTESVRVTATEEGQVVNEQEVLEAAQTDLLGFLQKGLDLQDSPYMPTPEWIAKKSRSQK